MKKFLGIAASLAMAGALVVPASSATAAESDAVGVTAMRVNVSVTLALLKANVTVNGQDPGGSTILEPGKLALEFPVSGVKKGKVGHLGSLFLSHNTHMGLRTVVVDNLTADPAKGTLKGRVYATDTDLGTYTIFRLTNVKTSGTTTTYTVKLAPGVAGVLNSGLGTNVFAEGMRIGSGATVLIPQ